ncbi:MAG: hypothetical protein ABR548_13285 [Actinomycetota bacterium]|nr:hypothetical protein [Actinomycetota bacterium]
MLLATTLALLTVPGTGHADPFAYCSGSAKVNQNKPPGTGGDPLAPIRSDCRTSDTTMQTPAPGTTYHYTPTEETPVTVTLDATSFTGELTAQIIPVGGSLVGGGGTASGIFLNGQLLGPIPGQPNMPNATLTAGVGYKLVGTAHGIGVFIVRIDPRVTEPLPLPTETP